MISVWKKFLMVVALALAAVGPSQAATYTATYNLGDLGSAPSILNAPVAGSFLDRINFNVVASGTFGATTTNFTLFAPLLNIKDLAVSFYDSSNNLIGTGLSFTASLLAGSYYAVVSGIGIGIFGGGGAYTFSAAAPVPLPAALWLLAAGLAGLVGIARRKRPESAPLVK
jgi:hypothetical protein